MPLRLYLRTHAGRDNNYQRRMSATVIGQNEPYRLGRVTMPVNS